MSHEDLVIEDVESASLPAHVALCNERYGAMGKRLEEIEQILKDIRKDFKNLVYGALGLLMTITGTLVYRFVLVPL